MKLKKTQPQSRNEQIFQLVNLKRFWAINDVHSLSSIDFISFHKKRFFFLILFFLKAIAADIYDETSLNCFLSRDLQIISKKF